MRWGWVSALLILIFCSIVYSLNAIILPFLLGFVGAYASNGLVSRLEKIHIARGVGSALVILGVIFLLILLLIVAFPYLQQQLITLAIALPKIVDTSVNNLKPFLDQCAEKFGTPDPAELKTHLSSHVGDILSWSVRIITGILSNGMVLANLISLVFLTPIIMFYLLKDWPKLIRRLDVYIPPLHKEAVHGYVKKIDDTLSAYAKGQATVCLVLMILYSIALWAVGLNQGLFIGVLTGFLSFIPYLGAIIGLLTSVALAFTQDPSLIVPIMIVFFVVGMTESNILAPRLIGEKVGLHPVWIIFSLLAGASWFGFLGILVALPVGAIIGVVVRFGIEWYLTSPLYNKHILIVP